MSDLTTLSVTAVALLLVAGGVAVGFTGATPAAETADLEAQETTTQAGGAQADTNVTARNVTVERLVLRNVTVVDARFGTVTVTNATDGNATNETYRNVSVQRVRTTGNVTDLTLTNVSFNSETLASNLVNETGRQRIDTRLVMDRAVLQNHTVNGLVVESANVSGSAVENVSVSAGGANATGDGAGTDGQPALAAETAVVEGVDLADLEVTGLSTGGQATATTATADGTTTAAGGETTVTTGETTAAVDVETTGAPETTLPAEAGNRTISEGND